MSYKTVLVHLDYGRRCKDRLALAFGLARAFDAHVVGVHALTAQPVPAYLQSEAGSQLQEASRSALAALARDSEVLFRKALDAAGEGKAEFRATEDDAVDAIDLHARYADLVIVGQPNSEDYSGVEAGFVARILLSAGRPVLILPYAGSFAPRFERVLVAWNGSREATRAVTDALPLLSLASRVDVAVFNPTGQAHGELPGTDIALYLARHGVNARVVQEQAPEIDVGNLLLSRAADLDSKLIVMGAYGHSRLAELVLGGVTRTLLQSMTVPVLMSH